MNQAASQAEIPPIDLSAMNRPDKISGNMGPTEKQVVRYFRRLRSLVAFAAKKCLDDEETSPEVDKLHNLAKEVIVRMDHVTDEDNIDLDTSSEDYFLGGNELEMELLFTDNTLFERAQELEQAVNVYRNRATTRFRLADLRAA